MHNCVCCGDIIYTTSPLCGDCVTADCQANDAGEYNDCERPCEGCGVPSIADYYFMVIFQRTDGETDYTDGFVCEEHAVDDAEAYAPNGCTVLEFELTEVNHAGIGLTCMDAPI